MLAEKMKKESTLKIELNFYYMHSRDAEMFLQWASDAEKNNSKLKSLYARHVILSSVFASEALINRVLNDFYLPKSASESMEKLSIPAKWIIAPLVCTKNQTMKTFDKGKTPYQSFKELVRIRNWLVHPKPEEYIDGNIETGTISLSETDEKLPWVETIKSKRWPQTHIPLNPFELNKKHAEKSIDIIKEMIKKLQELMPNQITEKWLGEINFIDKKLRKKYKGRIESLWGGYTPGN